METITERIKNVLENQHILEDTRPQTGFYPSSASVSIEDPVLGKTALGACLRKQWYDWYRFPGEGKETASSIGRSLLGSWTHDGFQALLQSIQIYTDLYIIKSEHAFWKPNWKLSGRLDLLCFDKKANRYVILEIKTVNKEFGPAGFKAQIECPKLEYILQGTCYYYSYEELNPRVIILYVNLMAGQNIDFLFEFELLIPKDPDANIAISNGSKITQFPEITMNKIVQRWVELENYITNKQLPPRDFWPEFTDEQIVSLYYADALSYKAEYEVVKKWLAKGANDKLEMPYGKGSKQCSWCPYVNLCKKDYSSFESFCPTSSNLKSFNDKMEVLNYVRDKTDQSNNSINYF